jgi:hypothetical protein
MAKHFAIECGECCRFAIYVDGWRETMFDESEEFEFAEMVKDLGIVQVTTNMCSDCDLRYN